MSEYQVPAARYSVELRFSNSRFIAEIDYTPTIELARQFRSDVKSRFPDATHHVPAYVIGFGKSVTAHSSDDGEPSGTAGKPALAVLAGSGLGDAALVIVRYFGGSKLGAGGLARAYRETARSAVDGVSKARIIRFTIAELKLDYSRYNAVGRLLRSLDCIIDEEDFTEDVHLKIAEPDDLLNKFTDQLRELSNGELKPHILESNQVRRMPILR